ncbi:hypothetical protein [Flavobacterium sp. KACC 22761]|uniref:hypothetical protein n=1 Tax=Flavobacterium sp. KACC 22761 TaxID=3092665 RepID=UPI002A75569B|nr:hypothetical protein [Flavobacterium sp. KACC 22761]WPO78980.1 hypothetical protein SCB73_01035 [Flavobacterium sp. KACC 22761]
MKNIIVSLMSALIFLSCGNNKKENKVLNFNKKNVDSAFHYKNLMLEIEDSSDTIQPKNLKQLLGIWVIDSIAEIGGTMQNEHLIQSQVGHHLVISDSLLTLPFLNHDIKIIKPKYSLVKDKDAKASSLFYGYKNSREFVTSLKADEGYYFEIINYHELAYFYDGRIYFFKRKA